MNTTPGSAEEKSTVPESETIGTGPVRLLPSAPLNVKRPDWPGMRSRWIVPPVPGGWAGFALSEWELHAATWSDLHHHDEYNLVLEGELHVTSGGHTRIARAGDTVVVAAGNLGRYSAPVFARMIAVYGPNPGLSDEEAGYEALPGSGDASTPPGPS